MRALMMPLSISGLLEQHLNFVVTAGAADDRQ
jgi:hypothetical protein